MLVTLVLARVIAEAHSPLPVLDDGGVLLVKRRDVVVGEDCTPDGDAGVPVDGGIDAPDDAGPVDAGVPDADAGDATPDAGCEVIHGDAVSLMVQPRFSQVTSGARFALLMVTPSRPLVETNNGWVFGELETQTAPKVVIHETRVEDPALGKACNVGCTAASYEADPSFTPPGFGTDGGLGNGDGGFDVVQAGPYQIVRAQPADAAELQTWLTGLGYLTLPADVNAVTPYIALGFTVVAVRVSVDGYTDGALPPLMLTWAGSEMRLPVGLGAPAGGGTRRQTVYIAADGRYELPGATVPFAWRTSFGDAGFLTKNVVDLEMTGDPEDDPIALEVAEAYFHESHDEYVTKKVPVSDCGEIGCGCRECSAQKPLRADMVAVVLIAMWTLRPRRRGARTSRRA